MLKNKIRSRKAAASGGGGGMGKKDFRTNIWMRFKRKKFTQKQKQRSKPVFSDFIDQMKEKAHGAYSSDKDSDAGHLQYLHILC